MNDTLDLLHAHRSVRRFRGTAPDDETVRAAVRAAQHASTSSNVQAYALIRVRDPRERDELARLTGGQAQVAEAGAFFVIAGDQRRHLLAARRRDKPHVANLETFLVAVVDASLFAQNLVIAFESQGLGVCYIGGLRNELEAVDELLELPEGVLPLYGLCVGVPDEAPPARPRLPLDAVLCEGRYPSDEELGAQLDDYDVVTGEYYRDRGEPGHDWTGGVAAKFRMARRAALARYYRSKGASLD